MLPWLIHLWMAELETPQTLAAFVGPPTAATARSTAFASRFCSFRFTHPASAQGAPQPTPHGDTIQIRRILWESLLSIDYICRFFLSLNVDTKRETRVRLIERTAKETCMEGHKTELEERLEASLSGAAKENDPPPRNLPQRARREENQGQIKRGEMDARKKSSGMDRSIRTEGHRRRPRTLHPCESSARPSG